MKFKEVKLKDITNLKQWKNLPISQLSKEGYSVYGANGIIGYYHEYNHEQPTLTITCRGATCGNIHVTVPKSYITSNAMALDNLDIKQVDINYLKFFLRSRGFRDVITGSAQPQIVRKNLEKIKISIPENLNDQKKIANLLTQVEALIAKRKESIELLDELLRSSFLDMFGDPILNPKNFKTISLDNFFINPKEGTKCGPFGSALKKNEYVKEGIAVWNMDNISKKGDFLDTPRLLITEEKFQELKSYTVLNGDIIISRAGTVGKMCVVDSQYKQSIISTNLIRLRLDDNKLLPIYFVKLMTYFKDRLKRLETGSDGSLTHMSTKVLKSLEFPYPPKPLQDKFATIVKQVESTKEQYQKSLDELRNLFGSLSQRAFRGELELI